MVTVSDEMKRQQIRDAYVSKPWQEKVDRMPAHQVSAVWDRLRNQKKI